MAYIQLDPTEIRLRLEQYKEAERKILKNQSYTVGTRTYTRANLKWVQKGISDLEKALAAASGGGTIRVLKALFRD